MKSACVGVLSIIKLKTVES